MWNIGLTLLSPESPSTLSLNDNKNLKLFYHRHSATNKIKNYTSPPIGIQTLAIAKNPGSKTYNFYDLRSSGMLRIVDLYLPTFRDNISVPSSKGQAAKELPLEDGRQCVPKRR